MRRRFESPQPNNPHQLTVRQHVFPKQSIARFARPDGTVSLVDKQRGLTRGAVPDDDMFCARRVWDQRAEAGYMKSIEDEFHSLADQLVARTVTAVDSGDKVKVDAFYALWRTRAEYKYAPDDEVQLRSAQGHNWTKDEEERFEKAGASFIRKGGRLPARILHGMHIRRAIDAYLWELERVQWGVIECQDGHLIVPDYPSCLVLPLSPTLCLGANCETGTITKENLARVNDALREASVEYYFAQDLALCP